MASPTKTLLLAAFGAVLALPVCAQTMAAPKAPDATGPQTAVPAPLGNGRADTPGGSARNGVIAPPPTTGTPVIRPSTNSRMPVVRPPAHGTTTSRMPVITPPGSTGNSPVVPK